jgi:6-pyruvoyltetrahydropterin/6-carboxytetrahydropterin synthase
MIEITQEFRFDAAHCLPIGAAQNARIHGHSFLAEVTLRGEPSDATGVIRDFGEVETVLAGIRGQLDHRLLNDVPDLGPPTLENLSRFIFQRARAAMPDVVRVRVLRPSYGHSCVYEG